MLYVLHGQSTQAWQTISFIMVSNICYIRIFLTGQFTLRHSETSEKSLFLLNLSRLYQGQ
jgi:hypothetical protein